MAFSRFPKLQINLFCEEMQRLGHCVRFNKLLDVVGDFKRVPIIFDKFRSVLLDSWKMIGVQDRSIFRMAIWILRSQLRWYTEKLQVWTMKHLRFLITLQKLYSRKKQTVVRSKMIKCGRRFDVCHCYLYCHDSAVLLAFKKFIGIYGVVFIARESRLRSKRSKHSAFELKVF